MLKPVLGTQSETSSLDGLVYIIYALAVFLSANLLFILQPITAKRLLPMFGGTPATWTICMLFFQSMLLLGYAYAWQLSRIKNTTVWRTIHILICLGSLYWLPLHITTLPSDADPVWVILKTLVTQLGLPVLVVAASAPLLQFALSQTNTPKASNPYFLYVASNVGSLLALLSYPFMIERTTGVSHQFELWNDGYILYLSLLTLALLAVQYAPNHALQKSPSLIRWKDILAWVGLSFIPCSLMLGVTLYISTDVGTTPLLWVIPLTLYLLSFIMTFSETVCFNEAWLNRLTLTALVFSCISVAAGTHLLPMGLLIALNLASFFILAVFSNHQLFRRRPQATHLTSFYLCIAVGGVLAGVFNGLVAPRLFSEAYEYPLVLLLGLAMTITRSGRNTMRFIGVGLLLVGLLLQPFGQKNILDQRRNFYGVKRVFSQQNTHYLMHQTTLHGYQVQVENQNTNGTIAYYGPISAVIHQLKQIHQPLHASILGLGAGTLLCQFHADDHINFIEIDEQVIQIASNPSLFTYIQDCPATPNIIHQDGRLAIQHFNNQSQQLLILDAFSSDAIPVHLLTREAFVEYQKKLTSNGVILINVSNRHLNVLPVITAAAHERDWIMLTKSDSGNSRLGQIAAQWVLLTANESLAQGFIHSEHWRFVTDPTTLVWTDDYSNIIPLLRS